MIVSLMKIGSLLTALALPFTQKVALERPTQTEQASDKNFFSFKMKGIDGKEIDFSQFKGKKIVVLNTASKCGFTPQFEGLQKLHKKYNSKGLEILGFPCSDFKQEYKKASDAKTFCQMNYGVEFTIFDKVHVNGKEQSELFRFLKDQKRNLFFMKRINWNFNKFLIDREGKVILKSFNNKAILEIINR